MLKKTLKAFQGFLLCCVHTAEESYQRGGGLNGFLTLLYSVWLKPVRPC